MRNIEISVARDLTRIPLDGAGAVAHGLGLDRMVSLWMVSLLNMNRLYMFGKGSRQVPVPGIVHEPATPSHVGTEFFSESRAGQLSVIYIIIDHSDHHTI